MFRRPRMGFRDMLAQKWRAITRNRRRNRLPSEATIMRTICFGLIARCVRGAEGKHRDDDHRMIKRRAWCSQNLLLADRRTNRSSSRTRDDSLVARKLFERLRKLSKLDVGDKPLTLNGPQTQPHPREDVVFNQKFIAGLDSLRSCSLSTAGSKAQSIALRT